MTLHVAFTPAGLGPQESAGRVVFVIDVLRATTTICAALHHGARAVIPCDTPDEAVRMAQTLGSDVLLAGERQALPIPGFHLGNSPREMTREAVSGKLLALATTNGTRALLSVNGAAHVYAAAAVNLTVAAARARQAVEEGQGVLVLCAGREGAFALDDAYTAGRFLLKAFGPDPALACNDAARASLVLAGSLGAAWTTVFSRTRAAADLVASDLAADIAVAGTEDAFPVLPELRDRRLTIPAA